MAEPTRVADGKFTKMPDGGTAVLDTPKTEEISKEGLEGLQLLKDNLMGRKPAEKKADDETVETDEKKEQAAAKAKSDADAKAKAAADKKRKAAPVKRAEPEPLTADAIGEAVAKRLQPKVEPKKEEAKPDISEGLGRREKRMLPILAELETLYPDQYKGVAEKFADGQRKLNVYAAQWRKDNPGQEFDPKSAEHSDWFAENDVDWDEEDYEEARESLHAKRLEQTTFEKVTKKLEPKFSEIDDIKAREKLAQSHGIIKSEQVTGLRGYWSAIDEKFKDLVRADGSVDEAGFQAMVDEDPETHKVMVDTSVNLNIEVAEARKLFAEEGQEPLIKFDGNNPAHKFVLQFSDQLEADMLAGPAEAQINEKGQQLTTPAKYAALPPGERKNYWVLGFTEIRDALIADRANSAKKAVEAIEQRFLERAKRRKLIADEQKVEAELARPAVQPTAPKGFAFRNGVNPKPNSPGSTGDSKLAAHTRANGNSGKNDDPTSLKAFMRR